jgi:hypothetical protein
MNNMNNLLFEVSDSRFSVHYLSSNSILSSWSLDLSSKAELLKKEIIVDFLVKEGISLLNYSNALVLWSSRDVVLVPSNLFSNSDFDKLFELNFGKNYSKNDSDYNRNHLLGTVSLFTIPLWIKSLFVTKFPGSKIIHSSTAWLNYLTAKNTSVKFHGILAITESHFDFIVFSMDKPILFLQNSFNEMEDIIYHISFSMQKMNLLDKKGIVEVFEFNRNANMISDQIITTIEQLHLANSVNWVKNSELTINSFNLCV